jgi:hypothetical protein
VSDNLATLLMVDVSPSALAVPVFCKMIHEHTRACIVIDMRTEVRYVLGTLNVREEIRFYTQLTLDDSCRCRHWHELDDDRVVR